MHSRNPSHNMTHKVHRAAYQLDFISHVEQLVTMCPSFVKFSLVETLSSRYLECVKWVDGALTGGACHGTSQHITGRFQIHLHQPSQLRAVTITFRHDEHPNAINLPCASQPG